MKNIKNWLKLILVIVVAILTFVSILSGFQYKIAKTGLKLMAINFDIRLIQEDELSNPRLDASESYEKDMAERSAIYNSEDSVIRWYANLNGAVKAIIWIADIIFAVFISLSVFMVIMDIMVERQKERRKSNCEQSNDSTK